MRATFMRLAFASAASLVCYQNAGAVPIDAAAMMPVATAPSTVQQAQFYARPTRRHQPGICRRAPRLPPLLSLVVVKLGDTADLLISERVSTPPLCDPRSNGRPLSRLPWSAVAAESPSRGLPWPAPANIWR